MRYDFLIDTYETERIKVISAWSMVSMSIWSINVSARTSCGGTKKTAESAGSCWETRMRRGGKARRRFSMCGGGRKGKLPRPGAKPVSERPDEQR